MSTKQEAIRLIKSLPEDCTLEDIQYQLYVRQKLQRGLDDAANGRVLSHEEVRKRLAKRF